MQKKKGAMELSVSTIVIIVLAMSMLIFGMILLKNIFGGATNVVDLTNEQVKERIRDLWGEDNKVVVYPGSQLITIEQGETGGFGIGIKNLLEGSDETTFSYTTTVSSQDGCGVSDNYIENNWIGLGKEEGGIKLGPGEFTSGKILIKIPVGSSLCDFRLRINVRQGSENYGSEFMDVAIKAS
jgi:hypothetical protein|tara:strand:+ start:67 stop:615 length:549 start_codon:yes stop_codon:yes gene_type:complete